MNRVEERMLRDLRHMAPDVNRLVGLTRGIPALSAQHAAALELLGQVRTRLGGDSRVGGLDDFARRMERIGRQVNSYYAHHPDAALRAQPVAPSSRGGAAGVSKEALMVALNMVTGIETVVFNDADGSESLKVVEHLQDIAGDKQMDPVVIEAARRAGNDPAALVDNLLALVRHDPPILSYNTRW